MLWVTRWSAWRGRTPRLVWVVKVLRYESEAEQTVRGLLVQP